MPRYLLDTDTVSYALRGEGRVAARILEHAPSDLCISSITLAELIARISKANRLVRVPPFLLARY